MKSFRLCIPTKYSVFIMLTGLVLTVGTSAFPREIEMLVEKLGAADFADREEASQRLWEIGTPALAAVREASRDTDPEIRIRSKKLLPYLEMGILPDWPSETRNRLLNFETHNQNEQKRFLKEIKASRGVESLRFLLKQLEGNRSATARDLVLEILESGEGVDQVIAFFPKKTGSGDAARVLAAAYLKSDRDDAGLTALRLENLPEDSRKKIVNQVIDQLVEMLKEKAYQNVYDHSSAYVYVFPRNARFMYLKGAAAAFLGNTQEASDLCQTALNLDPEEESAHYKAGELLGRMGQDGLAEKEWIKILEIPPEDGVYDINAYNRLAKIHRRNKDYERAADAYSKSLALYRKAHENGRGVVMMGADEEKIEKMILELRAKAIAKKMGDRPVTYSVAVSMNEDRLEKFRELSEKTAITISFNVQPDGLRLLEKAPASLHYLQKMKRVEIHLNGKSLGKSFDYEWQEGDNRILVRTLDMRYVYELDQDGAAAEKLDSFEVDYLFFLQPNAEIQALKDKQWIVDGKTLTAKELKEGIPMDYIPEEIEATIKGTNEDGAQLKAEIKFKPRTGLPAFP